MKRLPLAAALLSLATAAYAADLAAPVVQAPPPPPPFFTFEFHFGEPPGPPLTVYDRQGRAHHWNKLRRQYD
jgi:hypothetical protein